MCNAIISLLLLKRMLRGRCLKISSQLNTYINNVGIVVRAIEIKNIRKRISFFYRIITKFEIITVLLLIIYDCHIFTYHNSC